MGQGKRGRAVLGNFKAEADQLITELRDEKAALAKREKDLNDLAERLRAERPRSTS